MGSNPTGFEGDNAFDTSVLGMADTAHSPCSVPADAAPLRVGPFRIEGRIAEGAEGILYRAVDERLGRAVAIKVLHPRFAASTAARKRFLSEAKLAASIESDYVVRILAVDGEDSPIAYLAMELVEGATLSELVRQQGPLPPRQAVELVRQAALGLAAVHARKLIHRDIKSANLLLDAKSGRVKLADFGLAKVLEDAMPLTADNFLTGTPAYMSPEQITSPLAIDSRSDVYSLGVVLYELLTGQTPFQGSVRVVLTRILHEQPVPPSRHHDLVAASLDTICLRAMSKSPVNRYSSAQEFADALQHWLQSGNVPSSTPFQMHAPDRQNGGRWGRWFLWLVILGMAGMGGLGALIVGSLILIAAIGAAAKPNASEENSAVESGASILEEVATAAAPADTNAVPNEAHAGVEAKLSPFGSLETLQHAADIAYEKEDYSKACRIYDELRLSAEKILQQTPVDSNDGRRLAELRYEGEYGLFWGLRKQEQSDKAMPHGVTAEEIAQTLLKSHSSPEQFQRLLAVQSSLYSLEYERKNWASSVALASRSLEVARQYLASDSTNLEAVEQLSDRLVELGDAEYERNRFAAAEKAYAEVVHFLSKQGNELGDDLTTTQVEAELGLADCMQQQGREREAITFVSRVKGTLKELTAREDFRKENDEWLQRQTDWLAELSK